MGADGLAREGAMASVDMILTYFSQNISAEPPDEYIALEQDISRTSTQ